MNFLHESLDSVFIFGIVDGNQFKRSTVHFLFQSIERGNFLNARRAPGRPEVYYSDFTLEIRLVDDLAFGVRECNDDGPGIAAKRFELDIDAAGMLLIAR